LELLQSSFHEPLSCSIVPVEAPVLHEIRGRVKESVGIASRAPRSICGRCEVNDSMGLSCL